MSDVCEYAGQAVGIVVAGTTHIIGYTLNFVTRKNVSGCK